MPIRKRSLFRRVRRGLINFGSTLGKWIIAPVKLLFLPAYITELFHERGVDINKERRRSRASKNVWLRWLSLPIRLVAAPANLIRSAFRRGTQSMLLYFAPATLALLLTVFVWYQVSYQSGRVQERYFLGARRAMSAGNVTLAKTYFQRLMDREQLSDAQALQWAFVLERTNEQEQAQSLIELIAPDTEPGYPLAHSHRAIQQAKEIERQITVEEMEPTPAQLRRLYFHLSNANNIEEGINIAWATYYQYSDKVTRAIEYLDREAEVAPQLYLAAARLARDNNLPDEATSLLLKARMRFSLNVAKDPGDHESRVMLASIWIQLGQPSEAKSILDAGLRIQVAPPLRRGLADYYVVMFNRQVDEMIRTGDASIASILRQYEYLKLAIQSDRSYALPHVRLVDWLMLSERLPTFSYDDIAIAATPEAFSVVSVDEALTQLITSDRPNALDHAALGYLRRRQDDAESGDFHLKQAFGIDQRFGELARHLSVVHTHREQHPDFEWGLQLARRGHEQLPENADVRHSLGKVLSKMDRNDEAIVHLELALENASFPGEVHQQLSSAYLATGDPMKADYHNRQATAIRTRKLMAELE
ncbi:MAG: hypothetical protein AAFN77_24280 [Planctomycetota bacterium]